MAIVRRIVKWLGFLVAGLAGVAVLAAVYVYIASSRIVGRTWSVPDTVVAIPTDAGSMERGRRLARLRGCTTCHGDEAEGGLFLDEPYVVRVVAPDLTRLVRELSDVELERVIRHGVRVDGRSTLIMPSSMYYLLTDEDLGAILAFLRSLPPANGPSTEIHLGPLARVGFVRGDFEPQAATIDHDAPRPSVDRSDPLDFGEYLAMTTCTECHGLDLEGGFFGQAPPLAAVIAYSEAAFAEFMRTGKAIGDRELDVMSDVARRRLSHFTDDEIHALYAYLHGRVAVGAAAENSSN